MSSASSAATAAMSALPIASYADRMTAAFGCSLIDALLNSKVRCGVPPGRRAEPGSPMTASPAVATAGAEWLGLDEEHHSVGEHAVVFHRVGDLLGRHGGRQGVQVGDVHEHRHPVGVLRVDEQAVTGDTEGLEELLALWRGEPVLGVLHVVVHDHSGHVSS